MDHQIRSHRGVVEALSLTAEDISALLRSQWFTWSECPRIVANPDADSLRRWIATADAKQREGVLRSLAHAASVKGGDDDGAARVMAWLMLGPACVLARKYRFHPDADQHVAALLWLEIKQFNPGAAQDVWAYLVSRLRKAMFAELVVPSDPELLPLNEETHLEDYNPDPGRHRMDALLQVLKAGVENGAITNEDQLLILDILAASASVTTNDAGGSLLGDRVSDVVGVSLGVSGRTVRRRVRRSIDALAQSRHEWRRSA